MKDKNPLKKYTEGSVLKKTGVQVAGGLGGLATAATLNRTMNTKKGVLIPALMFGAGLAGLHYFNVNPPKDGDLLLQLAQGASAGTAMFGGLKTVEYGLTKITNNGINGLGGFIPKELAEKISKFIPTINGIGEYPQGTSGYYRDPLASMMGIGSAYNLPSYTPTLVDSEVEGEYQVAEVL